MLRLFISDPRHLEIGFTFIRVAIGCICVLHGWGKLVGGYDSWQWMGSQMANLGITFWPTFWGFLAMVAELGGGICLVLGLGTRLASAALAFTMLVAMLYHITKGDTFNNIWSHAFALFVIFIGFCITGSGVYSLDEYLFAQKDGIKVRK